MNLINTHGLCKLLNISRATLYRSVRYQKHFPKAVRISGHKDINILFKHYYQVSVEELADRLNAKEL